jgi:hypothetical protein
VIPLEGWDPIFTLEGGNSLVIPLQGGGSPISTLEGGNLPLPLVIPLVE